MALRSTFFGLAIGLAAALLPAGAPAQEAAAPPVPPQEVSGPEISMLIRTTMVAVHQANLTGNYTVLRELGSIEFQATNSAAQLAEIFRGFREKRIGLAAAVLIDATLDEGPQLSTNGVLRLVGHFPTRPQEIVFDLTFLYERGDWRIAALNVGTRMAAAANRAPLEVQVAGNGGPPTVPIPRIRPGGAP